MTSPSEEASLRVAIYARVSTREQQDPGNQVQALTEYAHRQRWRVLIEYTDLDSGAHSERPAFQQMLRAASRREFDLLLFWSLDRLSREGAWRTLELLNRLAAWGVAYRSYTEQYIDSCGPFGEAVVAILAAIARQEQVRISERTRAGIERARRQGKDIGRPRRVFDVDRAGELLAEGGTVRMVAARLGISVSTLRRRLQLTSSNTTPAAATASATRTTQSTAPDSGEVGSSGPCPAAGVAAEAEATSLESGTATGIPTWPAT